MPVISRIVVEGHSAENAVWSYEQPFPAMAEIKGHLAFYPDRVDAIEEMLTRAQCNRGPLRNFARSDEFTRTSKVTPSR